MSFNLSPPKSSLLLTLVSLLAVFSVYPGEIQAQSVQDDGTSGQRRLSFTPPLLVSKNQERELGRPTNRTAGGSRGFCFNELLIALVPGREDIQAQSDLCQTQESKSLLALTLNASPTFWFYVPKQSKPGRVAEFVLLNYRENGREELVSEQRLLLSETPGIVSYHPFQSLETEKLYRWQFSVINANGTRNAPVEGFIQRMIPDSALINELKAAPSPREQIAVYARHGIWHDALTTLAELHRQNPNDAIFKVDWIDLLSSVGLKAIAETPLVNCCNPNPTEK